MRYVLTMPAFSHPATQWHCIDWETCHRRVRELQVRIAKATKEQKWRKVKALCKSADISIQPPCGKSNVRLGVFKVEEAGRVTKLLLVWETGRGVV